MTKLFEPTALGSVSLKNRIVMAPLTRSRAINNLPNEMMKEYYTARATAGLIITEGTSPSPNGLGYPRIPGMFNTEQAQGWKQITDSVHAAGGKIFMQLMHTGRISHPLNMPEGTQVLAPSAKAVSGQMWTDQKQLQDYPTPKEMTIQNIVEAEREYVKAAKLAIEAGFDGVELHAANGYLLEQFLNPKSNLREDAYGGTPEKRMKFVLEVAGSVAKAIGSDKVGIRVSPYGTHGDMGAFDGVDAFYTTLAKELSDLELAYIHVVDHEAMGAPPVSPEVKTLIRKNFRGSYIMSGGYDLKKAEADLQAGRGDLVAFGRPFLANPDLVQKLKQGAPLKEPDLSKNYTPGPEGYTQL